MKPFNPILGETYEYEAFGFRLIAEQVSHHPPVSAVHAEHEDWKFWGDLSVKTSFKGNYLNVTPNGAFHVVLKTSNDHFVWTKPTTAVNNIIVGNISVDHHGTIVLNNVENGYTCNINLKKRGWFDKHAFEIEATVFDEYSNPKHTLSGHCNDKIMIQLEDSEEFTEAW